MLGISRKTLYARLKREDRILEDGRWDKCTLFDVNFKPASMSPEAIFKTWIPASMQGVEQLQQMQQAFWSQLANIATGKKE